MKTIIVKLNAVSPCDFGILSTFAGNVESGILAPKGRIFYLSACRSVSVYPLVRILKDQQGAYPDMTHEVQLEVVTELTLKRGNLNEPGQHYLVPRGMIDKLWEAVGLYPTNDEDCFVKTED
jgi:hypothetical protein